MVVVIVCQQQPTESLEVFISYQHKKQLQVEALYNKLNLKYKCWMDKEQMGGGDTLNAKIDSGIRGCQLVLSCVTPEYAVSESCRSETYHHIDELNFIFRAN